MPFQLRAAEALAQPQGPFQAPFQNYLSGTWENVGFGPNEEGSKAKPLAYNIMPLPERLNPDGYILKNFKYYETIRFNCPDENTVAVPAGAPNRGGIINQVAEALFYDQKVSFAEGPKKDNVVHVENGTWLYLPRFFQETGPYPQHEPNDVSLSVTDDLQQPPASMIAKQISVPHGNSVLALGSIDTLHGAPENGQMIHGAPNIPDGAPPFPLPAEPFADPIPANPGQLISSLSAWNRYQTQDPIENPHSDLTLNPNLPLQRAVQIIKPDSHMHWSVTTRPLMNGQIGEGIVTNIPFEQLAAKVIAYAADYWLLFKRDDKFLAYTQTILMVLKIKDTNPPNHVRDYVFPHVTCNTVKKIKECPKIERE